MTGQRRSRVQELVGHADVDWVGTPKRPLTGDQIASVLESYGIHDDDGVLALVAYGLTRAQVRLVGELGGPVPGSWPGVDEQDPWSVLAALVTTMQPQVLRAWRNARFDDSEIAGLHELFPVSVAEDFRRVNPRHLELAPVLVAAAEEVGVPASELGMWVRSGFLPWAHELDQLDERLSVIARWRKRFGERAARYAMAGLSFTEAEDVERSGQYDKATLLTLAALRSS